MPRKPVPTPRPLPLSALAGGRAARPGRIGIEDTPAKAVLKLAGNHQGAAVALVALVRAQATVDPGGSFGPFTPLVMVEALALTPEQVWRLFDRCARRDALVATGLLHALRLKLVGRERLLAADPAAIDALVSAVKGQVAGFGRG